MYSSNMAQSNRFAIETANSGSAPERAPIDANMTELQDRIQALGELVLSLEMKLSPSLRQNPPSTAPANPTPQQTYGAVSPLGTVIADRCYQIREIETRVADMLQRCEL